MVIAAAVSILLLSSAAQAQAPRVHRMPDGKPNAQLTEFKCVEFTEELIYGHLRRQTNK